MPCNHWGKSEQAHTREIPLNIGTGTGLAGAAMAGPFSAEGETCVQLLCGLVPRLNIAVVKSGRVRT